MPGPVFRLVRSLGAALLTPIAFSLRSGHFRSALANKAVSRSGEPLPWYTYPCIDFLRFRDFSDRTVLELGAGQSTLWWAGRAKSVVAIEGDRGWYESLLRLVPGTVGLYFVPQDDAAICVAEVAKRLAALGEPRFDVVVIDGLWRRELVATAARVVAPDGIVICDNAEGYGFHEAFLDKGFERVDFYGYAPGVILPHCTAIYFRAGAFVFDSRIPITVVATER